jgi:hypothetical protein
MIRALSIHGVVVRNTSAESSVVACHRVDAARRVEPMKVVPESPPYGEAQTVKVVGDEGEVPKANGFAEGESTACQTFTIGSDGDCR